MKLQKNKRTDITALPIVPGTLILSAAMLLAFLLLLVWLNFSGMISLPGWIEHILGTAKDEGDKEDRFSQEFLASLSGDAQDVAGELIYVETDPEALLTLLLQAKPTPDYYQTCTVTRTGDGSMPLTQQIFRLVSGEKEYAELISGGVLAKSLIADADTIYIKEGTSGRGFSRGKNSVFTPESELGLPSLARMQRMLAEAEDGKYTLTLSSAKNTTSVRAEFTDTRSGTREVYEILPDCGLIFAASSYLPNADTPYYTLTTEALLTDITGFDESVFMMPNP